MRCQVCVVSPRFFKVTDHTATAAHQPTPRPRNARQLPTQPDGAGMATSRRPEVSQDDRPTPRRGEARPCRPTHPHPTTPTTPPQAPTTPAPSDPSRTPARPASGAASPTAPPATTPPDHGAPTVPSVTASHNRPAAFATSRVTDECRAGSSRRPSRGRPARRAHPQPPHAHRRLRCASTQFGSHVTPGPLCTTRRAAGHRAAPSQTHGRSVA